MANSVQNQMNQETILVKIIYLWTGYHDHIRRDHLCNRRRDESLRDGGNLCLRLCDNLGRCSRDTLRGRLCSSLGPEIV